MNGVQLTLNGHTLSLSEIELQRGERELRERLAELRQCCPTMKVLDDLSPVPIRLVEVVTLGIRHGLYVDPLKILDRCGYKAGIPPELEKRAAELDCGAWA